MTRAGSQRPEPAMSIRRRAVLLGLGAAMSPAVAYAVGDRSRRIGMLLARRQEDPEAHAFVKAFRQGLEVVGMLPGRDYELEHRWLPRDPADARANADSVLAAGAEIIVVLSTPYLRAARAATSTVPIVFVGTADPIGQGFVSELARPARNITGFAAEEPSVVGKWLGLLKEAAPAVVRCTAIFNPDTAPAVPQFLESLAATGRILSVETAGAAARTDAEIASVVAAAAREPQSGLLVLPDAFMLSRREMIVSPSETASRTPEE